jgi:hypothetical protein
MRKLVLLVSVFVLPAAPAAGVSGSGLYGVVMRGPITPVCVAGRPCSKPAPGVAFTFWRGGTVSARVVTDLHGRYRVGLRPGSYSVRTAGMTLIGRGLEPRSVVVPAAWKRQGFSIDTGIR